CCACVTQAVAANTTTAAALMSAVRITFFTWYTPGRLRRLTLARRREQALTVLGHHHAAGAAGRAGVLRQAALDRHRVAGLHGVARPAIAHQAVGAAHLHGPVGDFP